MKGNKLCYYTIKLWKFFYWNMFAFSLNAALRLLASSASAFFLSCSSFISFSNLLCLAIWFACHKNEFIISSLG